MGCLPHATETQSGTHMGLQMVLMQGWGAGRRDKTGTRCARHRVHNQDLARYPTGCGRIVGEWVESGWHTDRVDVAKSFCYSQKITFPAHGAQPYPHPARPPPQHPTVEDNEIEKGRGWLGVPQDAWRDRNGGKHDSGRWWYPTQHQVAIQGNPCPPHRTYNTCRQGGRTRPCTPHVKRKP